MNKSKKTNSNTLAIRKSRKICAALTEATNTKTLSQAMTNELTPKNTLEQMLIDQCAALHHTAMISLATINKLTSIEQLAAMNKITTKLVNSFQQGVKTLASMSNDKQQTIVVKHQNVQVNGGQAIVAGEFNHEP